jgi:hypothetical protein
MQLFEKNQKFSSAGISTDQNPKKFQIFLESTTLICTLNFQYHVFKMDQLTRKA